MLRVGLGLFRGFSAKSTKGKRAVGSDRGATVSRPHHKDNQKCGGHPFVNRQVWFPFQMRLFSVFVLLSRFRPFDTICG